MVSTIDRTSEKASTLPADGMAERLVRHYQAEGFVGISEALILRIRLRKGDKSEVDVVFETAMENRKSLPLHEHFEVRAIGHFSESRTFSAAKAAIQSDFTVALRREMPSVFFNPAPVLIDDVLASGTKYDAMVKLWDNIEECAYAILLNDPDASFLDYLGSHHGNDWQQIMGDFGSVSIAFCPEIDLL